MNITDDKTDFLFEENIYGTITNGSNDEYTKNTLTTTTTTTDESYHENTITKSTWQSILTNHPPPDALPDGWILHRSRTQPGYVYYWNQFTGESTWEPPFNVSGLLLSLQQQQTTNASSSSLLASRTQVAELSDIVAETLHSLQQQQEQQQQGEEEDMKKHQDMESKNQHPENEEEDDDLNKNHSLETNRMILEEEEDISATMKSILKRNLPTESSNSMTGVVQESKHLGQEQFLDTPRLPDMKKPKVDSTTTTTTTKTSVKTMTPEQVHVLHILKKHKDSRRPSSWRVPVITITKEQAREELQELLSILQESISTTSTHSLEEISELRATFEELAKTESDCSSAKKGGDLGWFGKKKMQPAFEEASFALQVGELSSIVDTSSGLHILLRLG